MANRFKGEVEIEIGLGLPRMDTATRQAYTPPDQGYTVFDTQLNKAFAWDGTAWIEQATGADIAAVQTSADDKVSKAGDTVTGDLTMDGAEILGLPATPSVDGAAASKLYVDTEIADAVGTATGALATDDLTDVDTSTTAPVDGHVLVHDGTSFVNRDLTKADVSDFVEGDYATAAQGALADTATQPGDNVSTLTNDSGFISDITGEDLGDLANVDTSTTAPVTGDALFFDGTNFVNRAPVLADVSDFDANDYATGAEGDLAATALQDITGENIGDLADVDVSTPATDGQALLFDAASSTFIPGDVAVDLTNYVTLDGEQTISGEKTFTGATDITGALTATGTSAFNVGTNNFSVTTAAGNALNVSPTTTTLSAGTSGVASSVTLDNSSYTLDVGGDQIASFDSSAGPSAAFTFTSKVRSAATVDTDNDLTLTTKGYVDQEVADAVGTATGALSTDDLTDVDTSTTAPVDGHVLVFDGTNFVNRVVVKGDIDDFTESDYVHTTGDETIAGNKTFSNNVAITGDLTVSGTFTTVNSTDTAISDNTIVLNDGESGAGVTAGSAGLLIDRGTETDATIIFDETSDSFKVGLVGSEAQLATVYQEGFTTGDWTTGSPNTYVITAATHGLGYTAGDVFVVQVYESAGGVASLTTISTEIDETTGDITLSTVGAVFAGKVVVTK